MTQIFFVSRQVKDGWFVYTCDQLPGLYVASTDDDLAYNDLIKAMRLLIKLDGAVKYMGVNDHIHDYHAYLEAQSRIRYYEYSLRLDSKRLEETIMTEDTSELVASILGQEAEMARLRTIRP